MSAVQFTMTKCVLPFIPGDLIKFAVCVPVALAVRPVVAQYLYSNKKKDNNTENSDSEIPQK